MTRGGGVWATVAVGSATVVGGGQEARPKCVTKSNITLTASHSSDSFTETFSKGLFFWQKLGTDQQEVVPNVAKKKKKDRSVGGAPSLLFANRWMRSAPPRHCRAAAVRGTHGKRTLPHRCARDCCGDLGPRESTRGRNSASHYSRRSACPEREDGRVAILNSTRYGGQWETLSRPNHLTCLRCSPSLPTNASHVYRCRCLCAQNDTDPRGCRAHLLACAV